MGRFAGILEGLLPFALINKKVPFAGFSEKEFSPAGNFHSFFESAMRF